MDSKMYILKTIEMHENSYAFGGWVKVDFTNVIFKNIYRFMRELDSCY